MSSIRSNYGQEFLITLGLHQGSTLRLYCFINHGDAYKGHLKRGALVYAFVYNIIQISEIFIEINKQIEQWRK